MALELKNVSFSYSLEKPLIRGISLRIAPGDFTMLSGSNGTGKSTLLRLLNGSLFPQNGQVLLDGTGLAQIPLRTRSKQIATVYQASDTHMDLTVEELVMLGRNPYLARFGEPGAADVAEMENALHLMELEPLRKRPASSLSGGEKQRVAIASALSRKTPYLLLDEPTSAADPARRVSLLRTLKQLPWKPGILIVTHDIAAARLLAGKIVFLHDGLILAEGTPGQILTAENVEIVYGHDAVYLL